MTYNFDPDRWYGIELAHLQKLRRSEEITEPEFRQSLEKLESRFQEMWNRIDGTYRLP